MKISVITPCRNSEKTIERTIRSVLGQDSGFDLEYILVDGESSDSTLDVIRGYAERYPQIRYISEKDRSMTEALNKGVKMATGDLLATINADDMYLPGCFKQVEREFRNNAVNVLMVNSYIVNDAGMVKSHNTPKRFSPLLCAFAECPFPECGIFFRREVFDKIGLFNEKIKYTQDLEFYLRVFSAGYQFDYADIDASCFFVSDTNYSSTIGQKMRDEVTSYFPYPGLYKSFSGGISSKAFRALTGLRHYYLVKPELNKILASMENT